MNDPNLVANFFILALSYPSNRVAIQINVRF